MAPDEPRYSGLQDVVLSADPIFTLVGAVDGAAPAVILMGVYNPKIEIPGMGPEVETHKSPSLAADLGAAKADRKG